MPKKSVSKITSKISASRKPRPRKLEDEILQNLMELQKVNVNLAQKFESLTEQISNLLALFETTARAFAKQPHMQVTEKDREFLEKIDKLLDQNKTIAKGLTLVEQRMRDKVYGGPIVPRQMPPRAPPRF